MRSSPEDLESSETLMGVISDGKGDSSRVLIVGVVASSGCSAASLACFSARTFSSRFLRSPISAYLGEKTHRIRNV